MKSRVEAILFKNRTSKNLLSFIDADCWPHYVPAVCDEISSRSDFFTDYAREICSNFGGCQALFDFQSMIGDLTGMDAVTFPTCDWANPAGDALRVATIAFS